jgi:hypothetical protein
MHKIAVIVAAVLALAAGTAQTHHSYSMFDNTRQVSMAGTIVTVEWTNPHSWIFVLVPDAKGGTPVQWGFETAAGNSVYARQGWKKADFPIGAKVMVVGNPLRDGRQGAGLVSMTLPDGRVFGGRGCTVQTLTRCNEAAGNKQ